MQIAKLRQIEYFVYRLDSQQSNNYTYQMENVIYKYLFMFSLAAQKNVKNFVLRSSHLKR